MHIPESSQRPRAGYTILELSVSVTLFVVVLMASLALIERDTKLSKSTLGIGTVETLAQEMLFDIERQLSSAQGQTVEAVLVGELSADESQVLRVDSTLGFPHEGTLLLDRGTSREERIRYEALGDDEESFLMLQRGQGCAPASSHPDQAVVLWIGVGERIELQSNPPADTWDGRADDLEAPLFFRGDGVGFSFRIPVDPAQVVGQLPNYLDGDELLWGAVVDGAPTERGWMSLCFESSFTYEEESTGDDINRDGDTVDVFDVGQIRRRIWNAWEPAATTTKLGMGPTSVIQERCNWGGDLNNDGFDDPIFLWNPETRELHVRLRVIGICVDDLPVLRTVESVIFLRNEQEL